LLFHAKANIPLLKSLKMAPQLAWIGLGNMGRASITDSHIECIADYPRACAKYGTRNMYSMRYKADLGRTSLRKALSTNP
jgi:hypothetical protein